MFSFEWVWDMGHVVFMGGPWYGLGIIGLGLTYVVLKTMGNQNPAIAGF